MIIKKLLFLQIRLKHRVLPHISKPPKICLMRTPPPLPPSQTHVSCQFAVLRDHTQNVHQNPPKNCCRRSWTVFVSLFIDSCALSHYKKSKRCFNCGQQTNGIFNPAKEIIAKLKLSQERNEIQSDNSDSDDGIMTESTAAAD